MGHHIHTSVRLVDDDLDEVTHFLLYTYLLEIRIQYTYQRNIRNCSVLLPGTSIFHNCSHKFFS